jgi:hypothetical protein
MANNAKGARHYPKLVLGETVHVALETFRSNKVRFTLTALGMVIGTASLILVVTIGLTGKQYVLQQIQSIGANMIFAEYNGGAIYSAEAANDYMTIEDLNAVRQQVPNITASSPLIELHDHITARSATCWCWGCRLNISGCATSRCSPAAFLRTTTHRPAARWR